jgi:hypothetical protein
MLETRRRWTGALPIAAAVLAVSILVALLSPAVRRQLSLSFQRQPSHYVELYFTDETSARNCPVSTDGTLHLAAAVRSQLAAPTALPYAVTVTGTDGTASTKTGVVATWPGVTTDLSTAVAVPSTPYTLQVQLTGRTERLVLHCGGTS